MGIIKKYITVENYYGYADHNNDIIVGFATKGVNNDDRCKIAELVIRILKTIEHGDDFAKNIFEKIGECSSDSKRTIYSSIFVLYK